MAKKGHTVKESRPASDGLSLAEREVEATLAAVVAGRNPEAPLLELVQAHVLSSDSQDRRSLRVLAAKNAIQAVQPNETLQAVLKYETDLVMACQKLSLDEQQARNMHSAFRMAMVRRTQPLRFQHLADRQAVQGPDS
jgi:PIN domain nuclease of toxin-antitoxin system